jgi:hypothetical protein
MWTVVVGCQGIVVSSGASSWLCWWFVWLRGGVLAIVWTVVVGGQGIVVSSGVGITVQYAC